MAREPDGIMYEERLRELSFSVIRKECEKEISLLQLPNGKEEYRED